MDDRQWWQRGIVYQVYPRSFRDLSGDGVGDLAGVTAGLDHLAALGIDAIWLSPFYPSPMVDFGYDITDHTAVDPLFGSLEDFDRLVAAAHQRDIRVLVDFVPNHTSDQHPWFRSARSATDSPHRNWYLWADLAPDGGPPNNWRAVFGGAAWTLDEPTGQYYYHAYLPQQPDLNWRNPSVRQAQLDVLRFWLNRGVDGFRVDAFRQLIKDDELRDNPQNPDWHPGIGPYEGLLPIYTTDRPELLSVAVELRGVLDEHRPDGLLIAEMYLPIERLVRYYGERGDAMHLPSNMHLLSVPYRAEDLAELITRYEAALPAGAWPNWVLGNHDSSRIATRVGPAQARVAAMLLLTLRGTPILYYGDEIGMHDVDVPEHLIRDPYAHRVPGLGVGRDPARSPMQWTAGRTAGFCPPDATPWLPIPASAQQVNVATQDPDPGSMLSLHRRLIARRRTEPALSTGTIEIVTAADGLLAYRRHHADRRLLIALNLGTQPRTTPAAGTILLATDPNRTGEPVPGTLTLPGDQGVILAES